MADIRTSYTLQYLDALLKHGSFTKAAKDLYISQPYLTQAIKKIEKELGAEVINRKSPQLQLTDAGKIYYHYLETIEAEEEDLKRKLVKYTKGNLPIIRIGILPSLATYLLPIFLPPFMKAFPQTTVTITEDLPKNNEQRAIKDEIDFYIGQNPEMVSPFLLTNDCGHQTYYAIIPASSNLYQKGKQYVEKDTIPMEQLLKQKVILTTSGSAIRRQIDRLFQRYKITPTIILECSNIYTVAELSKKDIGVAFVPAGLISASEYDEYNLYPISSEMISLEYFIAYSATKTLTANESAFITNFLHSVPSHILHHDIRN